MNRPIPLDTHDHPMYFAPHFDPLGLDDDSPERASVHPEPAKIIARMPNLEEKEVSLSHVGIPSFWSHFDLKRITERQQNRLLWCIVCILTMLLGWSLLKPIPSKTNHSTVSLEPEEEILILRSESSNFFVEDRKQAENNAWIAPTSSNFNQSIEQKAGISILPTTSIDLTIDPNDEEPLSRRANYDNTNYDNNSRSVWDRNDYGRDRENTWNRGKGERELAMSATSPNFSKEYRPGADQRMHLANEYTASNAFERQNRMENQAYPNQQGGYDSGPPVSPAFHNSPYASHWPSASPQMTESTYSPDYSSLQYNSPSSSHYVPEYHFVEEQNYGAVQGYNLVPSSDIERDRSAPQMQMQQVAGGYSHANLRETIPAVEVNNTFRGPQQPQVGLKTADNFGNSPRYDGYSSHTSPYSGVNQPIDPRFQAETVQRY